MRKNNLTLQNQFVLKTCIGVILGLTLSYGLVALFAWFGPDNLNQELSAERLLWKTQFNMWLIAPIWMLIVSFVYLFNTAKSAFIGLGLANGCVYLVWLIARSMV